MTQSSRLRALAAASLLVAAGAANALVTPPAGDGVADYGNGGNIFQIDELLFIQGLSGNADAPANIVGLNPDLSYSASTSGFGSSMLTIDYRVRNSGATSTTFTDLRFMFFANPDGGPDPFLDVLAENWGGAAAGDPVRREGRVFTSNPFDTIPNRFRVSNNLNEGPPALDAACTVAGGCDATVGMQWNAPTLGPGETLLVQVGLSDAGQSLGPRWIDVMAVDSQNTMLTVSGVSSIIPIPEPAAAWMLLSGLALVGATTRRRSQR